MGVAVGPPEPGVAVGWRPEPLVLVAVGWPGAVVAVAVGWPLPLTVTVAVLSQALTKTTSARRRIAGARRADAWNRPRKG